MSKEDTPSQDEEDEEGISKLESEASKPSMPILKLMVDKFRAGHKTKEEALKNLEKIINDKFTECNNLESVYYAIKGTKKNKHWLSRAAAKVPNLVKDYISAYSGAVSGYFVSNSITGTVIGGVTGLLLDLSANSYAKKIYFVNSPEELQSLQLKIETGSFDKELELKNNKTSIFIGKSVVAVVAIVGTGIYRILCSLNDYVFK